jgi:NTF2 fold immunity protein
VPFSFIEIQGVPEKMQMSRLLLFSAVFLTSFALCLVRGNATLSQNASSAQESRRPSSSDEENWYPTPWGKSYRPKAGVVPNKETAAIIAEAILIPIYGDKQIQSEKPFKVTLQDNIWLIEGASPELPQPGGNFVVRLSKVNGKVLFVTHFQ